MQNTPEQKKEIFNLSEEEFYNYFDKKLMRFFI